MDTILGQTIDNYKILEVLGRGGMGVVFKALDLNLEKIVALKMIDPFLARDESFLKRFRTEAKALAKLEDRNIVNVFALRETPYGLFMIMEFVKAKTVLEWIRERGRFGSKETIEITKQLLHAINCAHKAGVIHRDIKPNNIMLCDDGTVKVMDFGLAKVIQENGSQTSVTQAAAGTLFYMSPEQIKGLKNVDMRSDIYSIGMTIYEMVTGKLPFDKSEPEFSIQKQIVDGEIPPPTKFNPDISQTLLKFIMKAIAKDADNRFQNIPEMISALSQIENANSTSDEETKIIVPVINEEKSNTKKILRKRILVGIPVILIMLISSYLFFFNNKEPTQNDTRKSNQTTLIDQKTDVDKIVPKISFANLLIESSPEGADVFINNKLVGKTTFQDSLASGNYSIILKANGYKEWKNQSYEIKPGNNSIQANLTLLETRIDDKPAIANSTLVLKMDLPGRIFIEGKEAASGSNEIIKSNLKAGKYKVKFDHPEFGSKETVINLAENEKQELTCYFRQTVNIQSLNSSGEPFWGTIYLNGENTNRTTPAEIILNSGTHTITVKKAGYSPMEKEVKVDIKPAFEEKPQSLVFHLQ